MNTQQYTRTLVKAISFAMITIFISLNTNAQERRTVDNNRRTQSVNKKQVKTASLKKKKKNQDKGYYTTHSTYKTTSKSKDYHQRHKKHNNQHLYKSNNYNNYKYTNKGHQKHAIEYYSKTISFRKMPRKSYWIDVNGENYLVHNKHFYQHSPWGFYKVKHPKYIHYLPEGYHVDWRKGKRFYHYNDLVFIYTPRGFKLINS